MGAEMPLGDEAGEHRLRHQRGARAPRRDRLREAIGKRCRHHQEAEAQARQHGLGEAPDIEHPAPLIEARKCRQRPAAIAGPSP